MSQNPLAYPGSYPSPQSKPTNLKPQLATALASLEVQLDQELARYRRTRPTAMRTPLFGTNPTSFVVANPQSHTANDSKISADQQINQDISQNLATNTNLTAETSLNETSVTQPHQETKLPPTEKPRVSFTTPPPPPGIPTNSRLEPSNLEQNPTQINDSEQNHQNFATTEVPNDFADNLTDEIKPDNTSEPPTSATQIQLASIVPTVSSSPEHSTGHGSFVVPPTSEPDDYLESSEALLRSLSDEEPQSSKPHHHNNSLLSPLGIGSMLLLLVASGILGIVLFQPKLIPQVNFGALFQRNQSSPGETNTSTGDNPTVVEPQLTPVPQYPNLANEEFPEVKNPNDIVGLTPKTSATPTPPVNIPANPATTTVAPAPNIPVIENPIPSPVAIQPTTQPQTQPTPVNEADLQPSANGLYQFVVENQGENTFANARKIVPDAYLSPDKQYIFVGAVSNRGRAKKLLSELQGKGLNARPYQP